MGQTFPDDQTTSNIVQETPMTSHISHEDHASDILRCHYGTLSQSHQYPVRVAQNLWEEEVITKTRVEIIKYTANVNITKTTQSRQYLLHQPLEGGRGIAEAKGHDIKLEQAFMCNKRCLLL